MKKYHYKNCQSLFGYAAAVHIRCKGVCQLCGCGDPLDFDLWRQMTVEHILGKSQDGYLKQINVIIDDLMPSMPDDNKTLLAKQIDALNTVTACSFCNSTTSRDKYTQSMRDLIGYVKDEPINVLLKFIEEELLTVLDKKRKTVQWKLDSIREAFDREVKKPINEAKRQRCSNLLSRS